MAAGDAESRTERLKALVRDIPDFPKPGIVFKDITPLLESPEAFNEVVPALWEPWEKEALDKVIGVEARGFIFAAPVALHCGAGFVPIRKPGRLPAEVEAEEYELEYGTDLIEIHRDAIGAGERALIVDDVLATGGTAAAAARLVERLGGEVAGIAFLIELSFLAGRSRLDNYRLHSLIEYS
ncbi:MAG: adenine phosphoribosyltransferase [Acidobacteria bacterium]|nr:MAG: adenine phosphoribosyltransferase [Acidobacteriota bacterium]